MVGGENHPRFVASPFPAFNSCTPGRKDREPDIDDVIPPVDSLIIDLVSMVHRADLDTPLSLLPLYASRSHVDRTNTNGRARLVVRVSRSETVDGAYTTGWKEKQRNIEGGAREIEIEIEKERERLRYDICRVIR